MSERDADYRVLVFWPKGPIGELEENVDVEVQFSDDRRYGATYFSLRNLKALLDLYKTTGENLGGTYVWSTGMVVVRELTEEVIRESVRDLLSRNELVPPFERFDWSDEEGE